TWRSGRAGDVANFLARVEKLVPFCGRSLHAIGQAKATQFFIHMTERMDAVEHLLPDVTAFSVAHSFAFDPTFQWDISFIHVCAETGNAGLNTGDVKRLPAAHSSGDRFGAGD